MATRSPDAISWRPFWGALGFWCVRAFGMCCVEWCPVMRWHHRCLRAVRGVRSMLPPLCRVLGRAWIAAVQGVWPLCCWHNGGVV